MSKGVIRRKLIICGSYIEVRTYTYFERTRSAISEEDEGENASIQGDVLENRAAHSIARAKGQLNMLIRSNAWMYKNPDGSKIPPFFLTTTFKDNITDLKWANREFSKFIQRFNYKIFDSDSLSLRYIAVPEFQERGAVHYHAVLFNMPFIKDRVYTTIRNIWGYGSEVNLMVVKNPWKIYVYLSKYMQKNFDDGRLFGKKKYFGSRNLKRPIVLVGATTEDDVVIELVQRWMPDGFKLQPRSFSTDFCGDMTIEPYRLPGYQTLSDFKSLDAYVVERLKSKGYREI